MWYRILEHFWQKSRICRNQHSKISELALFMALIRLRRGHRSEQQMMWEISSRMKILEYFIVITSAIYFSDLNLEQSRINWELSESNHNLLPKFFVCRLDLYFGLSEVKNGCRWTLKEPKLSLGLPSISQGSDNTKRPRIELRIVRCIISGQN